MTGKTAALDRYRLAVSLVHAKCVEALREEGLEATPEQILDLLSGSRFSAMDRLAISTHGLFQPAMAEA